MTKDIRGCLDLMYSLSKCLLYTSDQYEEYFKWNFLIDPYKIYFRESLFRWGATYAEEDIDEIELKGITRHDLRNICDKSKKILDKTFLEVPDKSSSLYKLAQIFYQDKINEIKDLCDELSEIYENNDSKLKTKKYLVSHNLAEPNRKEEILQIENPFLLIPQTVEEIREFINDIESNKDNISMKPFVFTPEFQILSSFADEIKDKGLSQEESQILMNAWSLLIVKAFTLNQLTIKLTQKEIIALRTEKEKIFTTNTNDSEVQTYSEYLFLSKYFKDIYKYSADLEEEKLNEVYQNHQNDEINQILKPFFDDLIPYYKSLITPEGFLKLTNQVSNKYIKFAENPTGGLFTTSNISLVLPIYFDYIPFKLIDPPSDIYNQVLQLCLNNFALGLNCPCFTKNPMPKDFEEIEELDTLEKQRYYVIGFVFEYYNKFNDELLRYNDGCLLMSILPWKIDLDCEDARNLETTLRNICADSNKNYDYQWTRGRYFARYLITSVVPATQPLNPDGLRNKMSQLSQDANSRGHVDDGNPFGCCSIQ